MTRDPSDLRAAGPLTLEEAEVVLSSRPPPPETTPEPQDALALRTELDRVLAEIVVLRAKCGALSERAGKAERERDEIDALARAHIEASDRDLAAANAETERLAARCTELGDAARRAEHQLEDLRRAHDTDAVTCREALDRVDELTAELERQRAREHNRDTVLAALGRIPEQDVKAWLVEPPITDPEAYVELARAEFARREGTRG